MLHILRDLEGGAPWVKIKIDCVIPKELVLRVKIVCRNYASFPPYIISPIVVVGAGKVG